MTRGQKRGCCSKDSCSRLHPCDRFSPTILGGLEIFTRAGVTVRSQVAHPVCRPAAGMVSQQDRQFSDVRRARESSTVPARSGSQEEAATRTSIEPPSCVHEHECVELRCSGVG
jgi:hypothetical protein